MSNRACFTQSCDIFLNSFIVILSLAVQFPYSVFASDAFFPFPDGIKKLIQAGVKLIIQPGGSIRDKKSIELANKAKIKMIFTGTRHFYH